MRVDSTELAHIRPGIEPDQPATGTADERELLVRRVVVLVFAPPPKARCIARAAMPARNVDLLKRRAQRGSWREYSRSA